MVATPAGEPGWLSVRGLDVAYDKVQVLFGVDLDVPRGQITALLGTNGAGKSTLLRSVGGVAPVTAGTIRLGGVDLGALAPHEIPRQGIAQMPGGQGVFPSLTVDENLRVAAWLVRDQKDEVAERTAMDKVAVSRALARLVAAGRVRRHTHANDKRRSVLGLTAKGWAIHDEVAPMARQRERELLARLDSDEQAWLARILDKLMPGDQARG